MAGDRFGSLVLVDYVARDKSGSRALFRCDCGAEKEIAVRNVTAGVTTHCADRTYHPDPRHKGAEVTYDGMHNRVSRERGPASQHTCVACGEQADHWAYDHGDPDQLCQQWGKEKGRVFPSSIEYFEPRCRSCHIRWDAQDRKLTPKRAVSLFHHARHMALYW
jgi:hypothetical protein